ncbi:MAG: Nif3-like dinuclear metal center hexameric protein [Candidatus Lokiarchaeota archaeon]|nr:Nif3-like dinuclear metal center hexameric protein [Candidatus Lokiarchaeota archaeon]
MKSLELLNHFKRIGKWVNWEKTVDQFLYGDPESEVKGIAVSWMPTLNNLEKALKEGCNLFVTHEALFAAKIDEDGNIIDGPIIKDPHARWIAGKRKLVPDDIWIRKMEWLEQNKIIVLRCHDFWDNYPDIGVHGAWAKWLGFKKPPLKIVPYYELHELEEITLERLSRNILEKIKPFGQDSIQVIGDLDKKITKIALATGAASNYRDMHELGGEALLLTDDGTFFWESGQWSKDTGIPLIIVNHSLSEEPGMRTLAKYLEKKFPGIPIFQIPVGCIFKSLY